MQANDDVIHIGHVRLTEDATLAEHTAVYVLIPDLDTPPPLRIGGLRLVNRRQTAGFGNDVGNPWSMDDCDGNSFHLPAPPPFTNSV